MRNKLAALQLFSFSVAKPGWGFYCQIFILPHTQFQQHLTNHTFTFVVVGQKMTFPDINDKQQIEM